MDDYIGMVRLFAGNFAPQNYLVCAGQMLAISQYTALYSIIGTYYGGNGVQTFALPNLQSRVAVGAGQGVGLSNYTVGQTGGAESVVLTQANLPAHTHTLNGLSTNATQTTPAGAVMAAPFSGGGRSGTAVNGYATGTPDSVLSPLSIGATGSGTAVANLQPYLGMYYIICINGIFPSRS